jgi:hypothetical protein
MRRILAITLFAVLAMPAILPLAVPAANDESQLPICCRRDGKHHCAMLETATTAMELQSQGLSLRSQPAPCPYRSSKITLAHSFGFYPPATFAFYAAVIEHPAVQQQTNLRRLISEARCHQKRGPPASFS